MNRERERVPLTVVFVLIHAKNPLTPLKSGLAVRLVIHGLFCLLLVCWTDLTVINVVHNA